MSMWGASSNSNGVAHHMITHPVPVRPSPANVSPSPANVSPAKPVVKKKKTRVRWSEEEDQKLRQAVQKYTNKEWKIIADKAFNNEKTPLQCRQRWNICGEAVRVTGKWTSSEDVALSGAVRQYGAQKWTLIAGLVYGRNGKQCRERWHHHLNPNVNKNGANHPWSDSENKLLLMLHQKHGNKWSSIAASLKNRTENTVRLHWNTHMVETFNVVADDNDGKENKRRANGRKRKITTNDGVTTQTVTSDGLARADMQMEAPVSKGGVAQQSQSVAKRRRTSNTQGFYTAAASAATTNEMNGDFLSTLSAKLAQPHTPPKPSSSSSSSSSGPAAKEAKTGSQDDPMKIQSPAPSLGYAHGRPFSHGQILAGYTPSVNEHDQKAYRLQHHLSVPQSIMKQSNTAAHVHEPHTPAQSVNHHRYMPLFTPEPMQFLPTVPVAISPVPSPCPSVSPIMNMSTSKLSGELNLNGAFVKFSTQPSRRTRSRTTPAMNASHSNASARKKRACVPHIIDVVLGTQSNGASSSSSSSSSSMECPSSPPMLITIAYPHAVQSMQL